MSLNRFTIVAGLFLSGCTALDGRDLQPGISIEADVRNSLGTPAVVLANEDGSRSLAYPRGPLGTQTLMADVGSDGKVRGLRSVLHDDTFQQVRPGMTREQILRMVGPPGETMDFPRLKQVAWDYRFVDTWGYQAIFSVSFDENGIVVSKITRRLERERGPR
ncbi:MAG: outer membrane protein assembly factor BamE [Usitatibacter sp.]